ncbi:hypothetical protein BpHYR1_048037 [Brachionus plicatilis]|uniref:Uncharacterized protein n=1 Tax=Brachionus plicatilis TaxID=10195 RepID=A0A3M7T9M8_BRAPC|nr:hypothetical protein BpHYR1_048037 [Brachionus plicatilis]
MPEPKVDEIPIADISVNPSTRERPLLLPFCSSLFIGFLRQLFLVELFFLHTIALIQTKI